MRFASSAPHHAKRTWLRSLTLAICSAVSRIAAEPDPLSLIPGPAGTESRCAPAITTLFGFPDFDVGRRARLGQGRTIGERRTNHRDGERERERIRSHRVADDEP